MKPNTPPYRRAEAALFAVKFLVIFTALLVLPGRAGTYHFSTSGNDSTGDGSQGAPWQSLAKARDNMVTGGAANTIKLKRGDVWYEKDATWAITGKDGTIGTPIIVEDWGTAEQLPVVAHMEKFNSGWDPIGSNRWRHTLPAFTVQDCFMDGNRLQKMTSSGAVTDATKWFIDSNYVYVYAPTNPGTNNLVEVNAYGAVVDVQDVTNIIFRNITFIGGRWASVSARPPTTNVTFDSCRVIRPGHWGIVFIYAPGQPLLRHTNPKVINCYLNSTWHSYLNSLTNSTVTNGITLEASDYGLVKGNTVADFGHTAISLQSSQNCIVEQNTTYPIAMNYYRALEVFAGPTWPVIESEASTDNIIRQNFFLNQAQVASKLWGQRNKYYSNVWTGARLTPGFNHNFEGQEADLLTTGETVRDNLIVNNTFVDTGTGSLIVNLYVGPDFTSGSVRQNTIANNLFLDWGQQSAAHGLLVTEANTANGADQLVYHNNFWKTSTSEFVIKDLMAPQGANNYQYTAAQANATISGYSGNTQQNPQLVDKTNLLFDLLNGSPIAATGKDMRSQMGTGFVDYDGLPWASTPSAGAYQYTSNVVTGVTPSAGTYNNLTQWVGMKFTVGNKNISVSKLGRFVVSGNAEAHTVKLVVASTGADVSGGSAVVETVGLPPGLFAFGQLAAPVTLTANTAYYLISQETSGGDLWHGYSSALTTSNEITVNSAVSYSGGFTTIGVAGNSYGPVALKTFDAHTTEFNEVQTLSGGFYNNSNSWRGLKLTVGNANLTIGYLGRWVRSGNNQNHVVKFVNATTGVDVTGGSVTVATSGMPAGEYAYAKLTAPVTLSANTSYYLVSQEASGQDYWYGSGTALTSTGVAVINSAVYNDSGTYVTTGTTGNSFGPVNFKY